MFWYGWIMMNTWCSFSSNQWLQMHQSPLRCWTWLAQMAWPVAPFEPLAHAPVVGKSQWELILGKLSGTSWSVQRLDDSTSFCYSNVLWVSCVALLFGEEQNFVPKGGVAPGHNQIVDWEKYSLRNDKCEWNTLQFSCPARLSLWKQVQPGEKGHPWVLSQLRKASEDSGDCGNETN